MFFRLLNGWASLIADVLVVLMAMILILGPSVAASRVDLDAKAPG